MKKHYYSAMLISVLQMMLLAIIINQQLMIKHNYLQSPNADSVNLAVGFFVFGLNIIVIIIIRNLNRTNQEMERLRIQELKFQHVADQNRIYRQHYHDLKNHLLVLEFYLNKQDLEKMKGYLTNYNEKLNEGIFHINTGLEELDALLNVKFSYAAGKWIKVKYHCLANLKCYERNALDVVTILGNLLDNAIEACVSLPQNLEKQIKVEITEDPFGAVIAVANTYNGRIVEEGNLFAPGYSTKGGKERGYGLHIVDEITKKLGWKLTVEQDTDCFKVVVEANKP